jgi:hypothetical protein
MDEHENLIHTKCECKFRGKSEANRGRAKRNMGELGKRVRQDLPFNFTLHTMRHTFGSWLAIEGVSLRAIQKLMGHKSITTTERYAHVSGEILSTAVQRLEAVLPKSLAGGPGNEDNEPGEVAVSISKNWCGGRESNPHSPCGPRDFKSQPCDFYPLRNSLKLFETDKDRWQL